MKRNLRSLVLILMLANLSPLLAQNKQKIDSLIRELSTAKDTARIYILHHLCWKYIGTDLGKANEYAQLVFDESTEMGYKKGIAYSHNDLGEVNFRKGEYAAALKHQQQALVLYNELGLNKNIADCYNNIAGVYYMQGDYPRVLEYLIKAAKIVDEKLNTPDVAATIYSNIGLVYCAQASLTQNQADYAKSEEYHNRSLAISLERGDSASIATSYNNLGLLRREHKDYTRGARLLGKSIAYQGAPREPDRDIGMLQQHRHDIFLPGRNFRQ
jgi:adenylate cyclase